MRNILMYLWKGHWIYASTGGILRIGMYRGHVIYAKACGIMPVLGEFFKLVCIEDITYVSVERPVELCQYCGNSSNWYV